MEISQFRLLGSLIDQYAFQFMRNADSNVLKLRALARIIELGKFEEISQEQDSSNRIRLRIDLVENLETVFANAARQTFQSLIRSLVDFMDHSIGTRNSMLLGIKDEKNILDSIQEEIDKVAQDRSINNRSKLLEFFHESLTIFSVIKGYFDLRNAIEHRKNHVKTPIDFKVVTRVFEIEGKPVTKNPLVTDKKVLLNSHNQERVIRFDPKVDITFSEADIDDLLYTLKSEIVPQMIESILIKTKTLVK